MQTSWRSNENVYPGLQVTNLLALGHTSVNCQNTCIYCGCKLFRLLRYLLHKLTRWSNHQCAWAGRTPCVLTTALLLDAGRRPVLGDANERRDQEATSLSTSGFGNCDNVISSQRQRPCLSLDRSWGRVALFTESIHQDFTNLVFCVGKCLKWIWTPSANNDLVSLPVGGSGPCCSWSLSIARGGRARTRLCPATLPLALVLTSGFGHRRRLFAC
mmetsp:Transcript_73951/g.119294  ORF Transcript_73951/g.119294 Transcript_73951/m.119294 type:complete len:215 (-) Transcript_73951:286-930(-)